MSWASFASSIARSRAIRSRTACCLAFYSSSALAQVSGVAPCARAALADAEAGKAGKTHGRPLVDDWQG